MLAAAVRIDRLCEENIGRVVDALGEAPVEIADRAPAWHAVVSALATRAAKRPAAMPSRMLR